MTCQHIFQQGRTDRLRGRERARKNHQNRTDADGRTDANNRLRSFGPRWDAFKNKREGERGERQSSGSATAVNGSQPFVFPDLDGKLPVLPMPRSSIGSIALEGRKEEIGEYDEFGIPHTCSL